jgi:Flavin containing amine oxidoreductase
MYIQQPLLLTLKNRDELHCELRTPLNRIFFTSILIKSFVMFHIVQFLYLSSISVYILPFVPTVFGHDNHRHIASTCTNAPEYVDVVVVGAGISGIVATKELLELDPTLNVVLLEATDRFGGRVKKGFIGNSSKNSTIEIGANWLHNVDTPLL